MFEKLEAIEKRYDELGELITQPEVYNDFQQVQALSQERSGIEDMVTKYKQYKSVCKSIEDTQAMMDGGLDSDMQVMAREELSGLKASQQELEETLKAGLLPRDSNVDKDAIVEIRAGTGGDEAALFAADLYRMYSRYAQAKSWQIEIIDSNQNEMGGFKEVIFEVKGKGAYGHLKYERGVHRVQRVPFTEASGRIHTSTATVAVLLHPRSGAWMMVHNSSDSPTIDSSAPTGSRRGVLGSRDFGTRLPHSTSATQTIGTFTRKIEPHQKWARRMPPMIGPSPIPIPLTPAQIPIARPRSFGSVKMLVMIDNVAGMMNAAPIPMNAREMTSCVTPFENAALVDATANITRPIIRAPLRPNRSPRLPAVSSRPANTST